MVEVNSQVLPPEVPFWKIKWEKNTILHPGQVSRRYFISNIIENTEELKPNRKRPCNDNQGGILFLSPTSYQAYVQTKGEKETSKEEKAFILLNQYIYSVIIYYLLRLPGTCLPKLLINYC